MQDAASQRDTLADAAWPAPDNESDYDVRIFSISSDDDAGDMTDTNNMHPEPHGAAIQDPPSTLQNAVQYLIAAIKQGTSEEGSATPSQVQAAAPAPAAASAPVLGNSVATVAAPITVGQA